METEYNNLVRKYNELLRCYNAIMREFVCPFCRIRSASCDKCSLHDSCKDFDPMEEEK